jgi:hypothetical protein
MQGPDQTETTTEDPAEMKVPEEQHISGELQTDDSTISTPSTGQAVNENEFDWLAIGVVILLAALFALAARLNSQPPTSIAPMAVLSATGCGLLVTAMRKLRTPQRPGLFEAGLAGIMLALFQFITAITYPHVVATLSTASDERLGFLTTWALIAVFSIIFSLVGAVLGHLAFAPLRPLPVDKQSNSLQAADELEKVETNEEVKVIDLPRDEAKQRPLLSYVITVLLFGLAPTAVGYVFSGAFDYMLSTNHFVPGPYPTLRLLSALLPWQIPIPVNLSGSDPNSMIFLLWQLWRFPVFLGNPTMFDVQALEPFVFNAAALALLLLTMREGNSTTTKLSSSLRWPAYLLLEIILGLAIVLPADLWIVRGLQGLLRDSIIAIPIRTLHILDQTTFVLNLLTGPLLCLAIGIIMRLFSRTLHRVS